MICLDLYFTRIHLSSLLPPLMAFGAFLNLRTYLESLLPTPTAATREKLSLMKKQRQDAHQEEPSAVDKQIYKHHGLHITDRDVAFLTKVEGCWDFPSPTVVQGRKRRDSKAIFDAVFLICSAAHSIKRRQIAREIYGNFNNTGPFKIKIVFLLGLSENKDTEGHVANESLKYGDILQGNFVDHYFNLTYKTILGYRWAQLNCIHVKLILKIDDDVFVDIFKFFDYFLPIISLRQRVFYGYLNSKPKVHRKGKYWVDEDEFSGERYPQFCNGFFVVATRDVITDIYDTAKTVRSRRKDKTQYYRNTGAGAIRLRLARWDLTLKLDAGAIFFRLEDVFTYGMVRQAMLDVQLVHVDVITHYFLKYKNCIIDHMYRCKYLAAEMSPDLMLEYHSVAMEHRMMLALPGGPNGS